MPGGTPFRSGLPDGWSQDWGNGVGNWFPDPTRFPEGMRPTFQRARAHGMKSLLWSEPERVGIGTELFDKHQEWLIPPPDPASDVSFLFDFGNPEAWAWAVDHFDAIITDQAAEGHELDVFRQDFNMDPLDYWNAKDVPGRTGMTQVKHVTGHLAFWDELRTRHPHLWIDSCASGGRRNDLETMRRSVPLLRSDYQFEPTGNQCHTYGISLWLPYYGTGVGPQNTNDGAWGPGQYVVRSSLAPSYASSVDVGTANEEDWALLRTMNQEFVRIQDDLLYSDFYPLTEYSLEDDVWMAFQFDRPAAGSGVVLVFRRPGAPAETMRFVLHGLGRGRAVPDRELRPRGERNGVRQEPDGQGAGILALACAWLGHRAVRAPVGRIGVVGVCVSREVGLVGPLPSPNSHFTAS